MPVFQSNVFQNNVFQGPHVPATVTAPSIVAVTFWSKRRYYELQDELEQEAQVAKKEAARRAALTPLQRLDEDIAEAAAALKVVDWSDKYFAARKQHAELVEQRPAVERDQKIKDLAEQIKAERRARVAAIKAKAGLT